MANWKTRGGWGYALQVVVTLLPYLLFIAVSLVSLIVVGILAFVFGLISMIFVATAWYGLGSEIREGHMQLYGILIVSLWLLSIFGIAALTMWLWSAGPSWFGTTGLSSVFYVVLALYAFFTVIVILVIVSKVVSGIVKKIVVLLLAASIIGLAALPLSSSIWTSLIFIVTFGGVSVIGTILGIKNFFAAGRMLERSSFTIAGIFTLCYVVLLLIAYGLQLQGLGYAGALGGLTNVAGTVQWLSIGSTACGIIAMIFASIAFFGASIPQSVKEMMPEREVAYEEDYKKGSIGAGELPTIR